MTINNKNMPLDSWRKAGFIATVILSLTFPAFLIRHVLTDHSDTGVWERPQYVGGEKCIDCHLKEYNDWKNSDHDKAMGLATAENVEGDFSNVVFVSADGTRSRFYTRDSAYFVSTAGVDGKIQEFQISYTFGVRPLQQYLIPFDKGRLQCLPVAWDSERKTWFSLVDSIYRNEHITPDNWLYWTNNGQNWNGMCADCHTTNLVKGYDPEKHSFSTSWSDIDVNCEACHGPGSKHLRWADLPEMARPPEDDGLIVQTSNITAGALVDQCARCHARRSVLQDYDPVAYQKDLLNYMTPQLPVEPIYYADGQIREEDYVYASFTQSYMYYQEVSCKDCHNVHSLELLFPKEDNQICLQCHRAAEYDTYEHTFHKKSDEEGNNLSLSQPWQGKKEVKVGEGAKCINCHMPGRYYMGVDFRRDHSLRVPRPDLSVKYGTPNACNECHTDKTPQWAEKYVEQWYGKNRKHHFSEVFLAATHQKPGAEAELISLSQNELYPLTVRATALSLLQHYADTNATKAMVTALDNPESIIRLAAVDQLPATGTAQFLQALSPLLNDPVKAVRSRAAFRLSALYQQLAKSDLNEKFNTAVKEYRNTMEYMGDFPSSRHNLGVLDINLGNSNAAVKQYEEALRIDNQFYPAMINLAILYNQAGKNGDAERLLRRVIQLHPEMAETYYYLGLLLAEEEKYDQSLAMMLKATEKNPEYTRIYYNIALLYQHLSQPEKAAAFFEKCLTREPGNYDYLYAAALFYREQGNREKVRELARRLKNLYPRDQAADQLFQNLQEPTQDQR